MGLSDTGENRLTDVGLAITATESSVVDVEISSTNVVVVGLGGASEDLFPSCGNDPTTSVIVSYNGAGRGR